MPRPLAAVILLPAAFFFGAAMRISVRHDFDRVGVRIAAEQRRIIPLAAAKALTFTAECVRDAEYAEMGRIFDRPTKYTLNSLRLRPATPAKLEATVWVKDEAGKGTPAINFIGPHIFGGTRRQKRFEAALRSAGIIGQNEFAVPAGGAKLDRHGNIRAADIVRILSQLRIQRTAGFESRLSANAARRARAIAKAGGQYVVAAPGRGRHPRGIWQRLPNGRIRPIMLFIRGVRYGRILDFFGIAERTALFAFPALYARALERELARAGR